MKLLNFWRSIRLKMSLLAAVILGGILVLYSFYIFVQLENVLSRNLDAELRVKAYELAKTIKAFQETRTPGGDIHYSALKVLSFDIKDREGAPGLANRQWYRLIDRYDLHTDHIMIRGLDGKVLAFSENIPSEVEERFKKIFTERPRIESVWSDVDHNGQKLRALQMLVLARDEPHYFIQIATDVVTVNQFLEGRLWAIAVSILIVVVLFSLAGLASAQHMLRPVREITEVAERLTHEDLSRRVEISDVDDEMLFLVKAFNGMIERLEVAFKHMAGMVSQMAHELKTPLTVIKGEAQTALRRERPVEKYKKVLESNIAESEKMLRVVDDLLVASNIEYDKEIFQFKKLDLKELLREIARKSRILADPKNMRIELVLGDEEMVINGDELHLSRLFYNLIDNAIKYSRSGSVVRICAMSGNGHVEVTVSDEGEGISDEDLPRIFERTYKRKKTRARKQRFSGGAGLGLHLCRKIAEAHRGELTVESRPGFGSEFTLVLPLD